ncbi:MAG: helicase SNF [Parachlamydia sp.]|nr:MAG: helicase SNF [Parachlamydia sp.]
MAFKYFILDKGLSAEGGFFLKISRANGTSIGKNDTLASLQKEGIETDSQVLAFIKNTPVIYEDGSLIVKISGLASFKLLKLLAATGQLFYKEISLIPDFFTPVEFFYEVQGKENQSVHGKLRLREDIIDVRTCDFIAGGPPHWFIKGPFMRMIATDVPWKLLLKTLTEQSPDWVNRFLQEHAEASEDEPKVIFAHPSAIPKTNPSPIPCLVLKDRLGSFADLWMDYGTVRVPYFKSEPIKNPAVQRDESTEKLWENDLIETGFQIKTVGTSHYYCPLDQVPKSLSFLLELGWTVLDCQGNRVIGHSDISLQLQSGQTEIFIRGKVRFETHEANLADVVGAFNRRDRFVSIGAGVVGLLPQSLEKGSFAQLAEEGEIVSGGLKVKKNHFGALSELFDSPYQIATDRSFDQLRESLSTWNTDVGFTSSQNFLGELRPYQAQGVKWLKFLYEHHFNGILADDMGLGKTVQVLAFLALLDPTLPTLIVVPTSLIFNWRKEIERFLKGWPLTIHHGSSRKQFDQWNQKGILLTSYTTLRLDLNLFKPIEFQGIFLDEAQAIKNAHTQTAQALQQLKGAFKLSITGTPVENHLGELWSHFHFLMPDLLGDEKAFEGDLQASEGDLRYLQKIKRKIKPFVLRRKKEEVAKDLPEKIEQIVWIEMAPEQRQVYEDYLSGVRGNLFKKVELDGMSKHRMEVLEAILRLRQICCHPLLVTAQQETAPAPSAKLEALLQDLELILEENKKVLVYSQFTSMLKLIAQRFQQRDWKFAYLDGSTVNREQVVTQFQEDAATPLFLISLKAGGIGLNLTSADYVYLFDPWWNEAIENQAIDRAHRIGRKETVIAKRFITVESIEEKIQKLKEHKRNLIEGLFDDSYSQNQLSEEDFRFLLS